MNDSRVLRWRGRRIKKANLLSILLVPYEKGVIFFHQNHRVEESTGEERETNLAQGQQMDPEKFWVKGCALDLL